MYMSHLPSGENIGLLSPNGACTNISGLPARSPEPSLSTGTVQMAEPLGELGSTNASRFPSAVKDHGVCRLLLSVNGCAWPVASARVHSMPRAARNRM